MYGLVFVLGCRVFLGWVVFFLLFSFYQLVLYVSVAVTGIYKMNIAHTPYRYLVLKN